MGIFDKLFGRKKSKKQETHVEQISAADMWFTTPTVSSEFPQTTIVTQKTEHDIHIFDDDYRQNEFLNADSLPLIEEEITGIHYIIENFSREMDGYTLFKNCHSRNKIGEPDLKINFNELKKMLDAGSIGQALFNGEALIEGFAFKTENTTYFGTQYNSIVTQLCISKWNDNTTTEILQINKAFDLVFVNWYNCDLIK